MTEIIQMNKAARMTVQEKFLAIIVQEVTVPTKMFELNNVEMALSLLVKGEKITILMSMMDEVLIDWLKRDGHENTMRQ